MGWITSFDEERYRTVLRRIAVRKATLVAVAVAANVGQHVFLLWHRSAGQKGQMIGATMIAVRPTSTFKGMPNLR